jgi:hypothetical protein
VKTYKNNIMVVHHLDDEKLTKIHKEELGLDIPEGYFAQSKSDILKKTNTNTGFTLNRVLKKTTVYKMVASIVVILGIGMYFQFASTTIANTNVSPIVESGSSNEINQSLVQSDSNQDNKNSDTTISNPIKHIEHQKSKVDNVVQNENDILVKSLFVEEAEVDKYIESSILEEI